MNVARLKNVFFDAAMAMAVTRRLAYSDHDPDALDAVEEMYDRARPGTMERFLQTIQSLDISRSSAALSAREALERAEEMEDFDAIFVKDSGQLTIVELDEEDRAVILKEARNILKELHSALELNRA